MKTSASALLASLFVLAACSAGPTGFTDAGPRDGRAGDSSRACTSSEYTCLGDTAFHCDSSGNRTGSGIDCRAQGLACVQLIGCAACQPGQRRCSLDNPQQTQQCATDGSAWVDGAACNEAAGQSCSGGLCQDRCNPTELTYLGCEYWPTITPNSQLTNDFSFAIALANPQTYPVTVSISGGALRSPINRTLDPGSVSTIQLPWVQELAQLTLDPVNGCAGEPCLGVSAQVTNGAYHVQSNGPIAAYQFNPLTYQAGSSYSYTNDSSLLLPTRVLTSHYMAVAHDNWAARDQLGNPTRYILGGFISIVGVSGAESGTNVTVHLSSPVTGGTGVTPSGATTRTFVLRQGDVVQLVGAQAGQDLTGTVIDADHPVAVFTGNDCTNMPADRPACDHIEEQLFPNETWGQHYVVSQLRDRNATEPSVIRIVSNYAAGLHLTFDGITTPAGCGAALNSGQHCEFQTASSFQVTGTGPFLVMQFMMGQGPAQLQCASDPPPAIPECMGDPASVTEVPAEQFRHSYDFLVPDTYVRNFVNVMMPTGTSVLLDGVALRGTPAPAGAGFQVMFVPVMAGSHHIESADGLGFGIKVYGVAQYTSYMYPGGLDLAQISPPG